MNVIIHSCCAFLFVCDYFVPFLHLNFSTVIFNLVIAVY